MKVRSPQRHHPAQERIILSARKHVPCSPYSSVNICKNYALYTSTSHSQRQDQRWKTKEKTVNGNRPRVAQALAAAVAK